MFIISLDIRCTTDQSTVIWARDSGLDVTWKMYLLVYLCLQHTILDKVAYAPAVGRLECGEFPNDPRGYWQVNGFGILGVFKKDWDRFGGVYQLFKLIS